MDLVGGMIQFGLEQLFFFDIFPTFFHLVLFWRSQQAEKPHPCQPGMEPAMPPPRNTPLLLKITRFLPFSAKISGLGAQHRSVSAC